MAELRPLVEMVFELLDHLCNPQQFRLNAEVYCIYVVYV